MTFLRDADVFGLLRTSTDVHTLGLTHFADLLSDCGFKSVIADACVATAVSSLGQANSQGVFKSWLEKNGVTMLGMSYRLDPFDAQEVFGRLMYFLKQEDLLASSGGPIVHVHFAGLPDACSLIEKEFGPQVLVFRGDEKPLDTLLSVGVPHERIPINMIESNQYDDFRYSFGKDLVDAEEYLKISPKERSGYVSFGSMNDSLVDRLNWSKSKLSLPLFRAHVGPYDSNSEYAKNLFKVWLKDLGEKRFLDVVSIGTSQLTQEKFGESWEGLNNGGGVPLNSEKDFYDVWLASRPMLTRTYAGTKDIRALAEMYESTINMAWHALSLWWFCQIDGRGPNSVYKNLLEHIETIKFIATTGKPFEANVPHHFAFRGCDDVSFVVSAYLAAKTAKKLGISVFVLQMMFNTPKNTWGVQDLAKARAMLRLVKELEDDSFKVILQPRAGLDYFSPDIYRAKIQLASVSAMMDDIDPYNELSPEIIHVVGYSEALYLADPAVINESIQITMGALEKYRSLKRKGEVPDMGKNLAIQERVFSLFRDAKEVISVIEKELEDPYSPEGLYKVFAAGFLPVPYLWECRDEFAEAVKWKTRLIDGGMVVVDEEGKPVPTRYRAEIAASKLNSIAIPRGIL